MLIHTAEFDTTVDYYGCSLEVESQFWQSNLLVANYCGVSLRTVTKIMKEEMETGEIHRAFQR